MAHLVLLKAQIYEFYSAQLKGKKIICNGLSLHYRYLDVLNYLFRQRMMKAITAIAVMALASGCSTTYMGEPSPTLHRYPMGEISLNLTQRTDSDLVLELRNTSSRPITNAFPESVFEGEFTLVQAGRVPCEAFHNAYFNLLIHALWMNPQRVIEPGGQINYVVALRDMVVSLADWQPLANEPIMVFATMRGFDIRSNAIILEHGEEIRWRTTPRTVPETARGRADMVR